MSAHLFTFACGKRRGLDGVTAVAETAPDAVARMVVIGMKSLGLNKGVRQEDEGSEGGRYKGSDAMAGKRFGVSAGGLPRE